MDWSIFFYALFAGLAAWLLYNMVHRNPQMFSSENFSKTATTLGFLTLFYDLLHLSPQKLSLTNLSILNMFVMKNMAYWNHIICI